jgi:hypothetical protein
MPQDKYSFFISYARVDNEPFAPAGEGWVGMFVNELDKHLVREIGRRESAGRPFIDYQQLGGSEPVSDALRRNLEASTLFVPILSPGWLASRWCREELDIFVRLHGADSGRIFPVEMSPVDDLPTELARLLRRRFWYHGEGHKPRTRWFPDIDATDRAYADHQQDMAREMAERLRNLALRDSRARAAPRPQAAEPVQPRNQDCPPKVPAANKHLVLVHGGDGDAALICAVARHLHDHHGLTTLIPAAAMPRNAGVRSSELARDLRSKLKLASAVLVVYRNGPPHQVDAQLLNCIKLTLRPAKDRGPPTLDLCYAGNGEPNLCVWPAQMPIYRIDEPCAENCARRFVARLAR